MIHHICACGQPGYDRTCLYGTQIELWQWVKLSGPLVLTIYIMLIIIYK